jgi:hypothetical protein
MGDMVTRAFRVLATALISATAYLVVSMGGLFATVEMKVFANAASSAKEYVGATWMVAGAIAAGVLSILLSARRNQLWAFGATAIFCLYLTLPPSFSATSGVFAFGGTAIALTTILLTSRVKRS